MTGIDFQSIRQYVPLLDFLSARGHTAQREGDTYRLACPIHNEKHKRSFIIYSGEHWFCHGKCQSQYPRGGDIIDLCGALWKLSEPRDIIERLLGKVPVLEGESVQLRNDYPSQPPPPKWPAHNLQQIDQIVRDGPHLYDLWECSPCRFEDQDTHTEEVIDLIFPGNPLLCCGKSNGVFATRRRNLWRGRLPSLPLIVPNPMLRPRGLTRPGKPSEHSLQATAEWVYLVTEFDFKPYQSDGSPTEFLPLIEAWEADRISCLDAGCAILWHLKEQRPSLPLVLAVHSGGISMHGWWLAFGREVQRELFPFMQRAHALGADHVTWTRSQFVRMPDGTRQNGKRQVTYYLDPSNAVPHEQ